MNGAIIPNHGFVLLDNIGESRESLLCLTDLPACCRRDYTGGRGHLGDWFFPNETMVPNMGDQWDFFRTRGQMVVLMHRRRSGVTGIYHCGVPNENEDPHRLYVGVYTADTGGYFQNHNSNMLNCSPPSRQMTTLPRLNNFHTNSSV